MFNFMKSNKKSIDDKIVHIRTVADSYINMLTSIESTDETAHANARMYLNKLVIEVCLGGSISDDKMIFNKSLPNGSQIIDLVEIIDSVITAEMSIFNDEDADINTIPIKQSGRISIEKINAKAIQDYVLGTGVRLVINPIDVLSIVEIGKKLRKKKQTNVMLLVGGTALLITSATMATIIATRNKNQIVSEIEDPTVDITDEDILDDDIDDMDTPVVSMDE